MKIPFLSFDFQNKTTRDSVIESITGVIDSKRYVLSKNVLSFEEKFSKINNVKHVIGVGSGLDALIISLKALGLGEGDEVIVASNAYIASWLSISNVGAKIVPVEPEPETFNIDPNKIEEKITSKTKAIMPVHLFGQACEMDQIMLIAKKHKLFVVEDNAQAHLAKHNNKLTGTFGTINATSFYPTKNLGAIGEAGCILTDQIALKNYAFSYRNYGSNKKYVNEIIGTNSRLDEIQAAILNVKLKHLKDWNKQRQEIAAKYDDLLSGINSIIIPKKLSYNDHVYHNYVIKTEKRDELQNHLNIKGIGTSIHYPIPPHLQKAYKHLGYKKGDFPIAEKLADQSLSLPIYPGLMLSDQVIVVSQIKAFFNA